MMDSNVKNIENVNSVDNNSNNLLNIQFTEEELAKREEKYNKEMEAIENYGLKWTIRSIDYIVENRNVTFNQLRTCTFKAGTTPTFNLSKAVRLIIEAGLIGSNQFKSNELDKVRDRAYEIMEDWRNNYGYIGVLHILLINIMEKKHFFMGEQDVQTLELLSYNHLQEDLVKRAVGMDILEKAQQVQAVSSH